MSSKRELVEVRSQDSEFRIKNWPLIPLTEILEILPDLFSVES